MLSPIATAGSAGVRALVQAADPVEALLDTPDDHLPGGSVDAPPHSPPGAQLALLAAQMPAGLVAASTAPPSPAAATTLAPTASPQEIAALELMLADPLHRELLANYAPPSQALGATGLAPDLVARYGADLASRLDQLGRAQAAVRDDFLRALDGAHSSPPSGPQGSPPSGPGWVTSTVFAAPEDGGPQTVWSFDPDRFAAAYAQGTSLAQRAFAAQCASLLGHSSAPASTTVVAHESADVATTRVADHFTLTGGGWSESGSKNGPGQRSWQAHGLANDGALAVLDPARPPELHQREAVWFDTALGWVTARENIVVKDGFLDKLAKVSFGVAAAWMVGRLDFLAFGPGTAGQIASQAAVGATTAAVTQLAFTGRLDFGGLLRTALTSGLTAGLAQVPQLQPWLATQPGLGLDPARLLGRAGLQGLLQEATGGRFSDGALASVANSLAASVGDTLSQGIDARVQAGELSPAEASAWRLMSQAARSAMAALGHPGDPMAGFAQDYLGGLLAAADVPVGHAAGGAPEPHAASSVTPAAAEHAIEVHPDTGDHFVVGTPFAAHPDEVQAFVDAFSAPPGPATGADGVLIAAGDGFTMGRGAVSITQEGRTVRINAADDDTSVNALLQQARAELRQLQRDHDVRLTDALNRNSVIRETVTPLLEPLDIELPPGVVDALAGVADVATASVAGLADMTVAPLADVAQAGLRTLHGMATGDWQPLVPLSSHAQSVMHDGAGTWDLLQTTGIGVFDVSPAGLVFHTGTGAYDLTRAAMDGDVRAITREGLGLGMNFAGASMFGTVIGARSSPATSFLVEAETAALHRLAANQAAPTPWADLRRAYQQARGHVDFAHIEADVTFKPNGQVKAQGGHFSTSPKVQRIAGTETVAPNGVIYGQVNLLGPDGNFYLKSNNGGYSSMTPDSWSLAQAKGEMSQAWLNRSFDPVDKVWEGSSSGINFIFYPPTAHVPLWRGHPIKP